MTYTQQNVPLPAELRLFLAAQVEAHLTPAEVHDRKGALRFVRLLHQDCCRRCAGRRKRVLKANERKARVP